MSQNEIHDESDLPPSRSQRRREAWDVLELAERLVALTPSQLAKVPLDEKVLGFANRWYKAGFGAAVTATLPSGLQLRHLSAPYFMATKLEAFNDRGNNDVYLSHDLEDVITVVDGREELVNELAAAPADVRDFVSKTLRGILQRTDFINALPGIVSQSTRTGLVLQRFTQMSEL